MRMWLRGQLIMHHAAGSPCSSLQGFTKKRRKKKTTVLYSTVLLHEWCGMQDKTALSAAFRGWAAAARSAVSRPHQSRGAEGQRRRNGRRASASFSHRIWWLVGARLGRQPASLPRYYTTIQYCMYSTVLYCSRSRPYPAGPRNNHTPTPHLTPRTHTHGLLYKERNEIGIARGDMD